MELIENEVTGLKKRVDSLEIKDRDILGDLGKLDRKVADLGISISSLTSPKVYLGTYINHSIIVWLFRNNFQHYQTIVD